MLRVTSHWPPPLPNSFSRITWSFITGFPRDEEEGDFPLFFLFLSLSLSLFFFIFYFLVFRATPLLWRFPG